MASHIPHFNNIQQMLSQIQDKSFRLKAEPRVRSLLASNRVPNQVPNLAIRRQLDTVVGELEEVLQPEYADESTCRGKVGVNKE